MKVAFLGGGTGGHLAPAIGVAHALAPRGVEALFLVAGRAVERDMLGPRQLRSVSLFGEGSRPSPLRVDRWMSASRRLSRALAEHDPDAVVLTGGWVSLPALIAGLGGRPSVLIEPNAVPGKVGRLLASRVDHTCLSEESVGLHGRRGRRVTGVPTLPLGDWSPEAARSLFELEPGRHTLVVLGGSQGARDLAALMPAVRATLRADPRRWQVLHVTGRGPGADSPVSRPDQAGDVPVRRVPFVADMGAAWAAADLALCRAGSGTVAELAASGTPSVLVPYPYHSDHHQEANGRSLVAAGAALMVPRSDPRGERSVPGLLAAALGDLPAMTRAAVGASRHDAAAEVADLVEQAVREGRRG